jgi:fusaric acid resistance family protein
LRHTVSLNSGMATGTGAVATIPSWRDWAFAIKTFGAATLALYLAMWLDLPRPYWALSTVYITSQVLAGATRSKALYRVCGTLLGAVVSVILVPNLVNAPVLLTLAIAAWVSACLYFSLLDRTPRSYVLMLAGLPLRSSGSPPSAVQRPSSKQPLRASRKSPLASCARASCPLLFFLNQLCRSSRPGSTRGFETRGSGQSISLSGAARQPIPRQSD